MTGAIRSPSARIRPWLLPAAAVLCALAVLWAAGGLRTVGVTQGRATEAEQQIELAQWVLVVHDLELVNRSPEGTETPPAVRLRLRATFTGQVSTYSLAANLVTLQAPSGPIGIEPDPSTSGTRRGFDPDVPHEVTLDYRWPRAPATAPATLRVVVRDEKETEGFLFRPNFAVEPTAAVHVDLPCPDRRMKP